MRKSILLALAGSFLLAGCSASKPDHQKQFSRTAHSEQLTNNLLIWYDEKIGVDPLLRAVQRYGADILYRYEKMNGIAVLIPQDRSLQQAKSDFEQVNGVLSVDIDQTITIY